MTSFAGLSTDPDRTPSALRRRAVLAGPVIAAVTLVAAVATTRAAGVPLRDPGHVSIVRLAVASALVAVLIGVDVGVRRNRWSGPRMGAVALALVSFFVTYFAYRNLKSVVPLIRPGALFDAQLADLDRDVLGDNTPAVLLHDLLGTGAAAPVLSAVYMLFFAFIPVTLALVLVGQRDLRRGLFFSTALACNWLLGAASYFALPSIGPFHQDPASFAALPVTPVSHLQATLLADRAAFIHSPGAAGAVQSVGAFASLHVAIYATAAITTHVLDLARGWRVLAWALTLLTALATVYFGWHYLLDDIAGLLIAVASLVVAAAMTGLQVRARCDPVAAAQVGPA
jgi:hypothetical protein